MRTQAQIESRANGKLVLIRRPCQLVTASELQELRRLADLAGVDVCKLPLPTDCGTILDLTCTEASAYIAWLRRLVRIGGPVMSDRQRKVIDSQRRRLNWTRQELKLVARAILGTGGFSLLTMQEANRLIRILRKLPHRWAPRKRSRGTQFRRAKGLAAVWFNVA